MRFLDKQIQSGHGFANQLHSCSCYFNPLPAGRGPVWDVLTQETGVGNEPFRVANLVMRLVGEDGSECMLIGLLMVLGTEL